MEFPVLSLNGHMHANLVVDPDTPPANIVKATDPFQVRVECHLFGTALISLGGDFRFEVYAESFGPGPEVTLGNASVNVAGGAGGATNKTYTTNIPVAAGTLPAGVYKLVTVLTHSNLGQPTNIVGFEEGPTIQIYTPNPSMP